MLAPSSSSCRCSSSTRSGGRCGSASSAATPRATTAGRTGGTSTSTCSAATSSSTPSWVTFKFALITVPLGLALGIGLAVLADKYLRGIGVFRTVFSSTVATSVAVASLMWLFLLAAVVGVLANVGWISDLFPVVKKPGLLRDPGTALGVGRRRRASGPSLGFTFILVTAGLQGIPRDLHEAAVVDGAGGVRRFWTITLPLLGPTLLFVVIVLTTRAFQAYGEIDLLTDGGPQPREPDDDAHLPHLRHGLDHPQQRRAAGGDRRAAVPRAARAVGRSSCAGIGRRVHYGELTPTMTVDATTTSTAGGWRAVGRYVAARRRRRDRAVPDVHDGRRGVEARRRGARATRSCPDSFTLDVLRDAWTEGRLGRLPAQLARRRRDRHRRPRSSRRCSPAYAFAFLDSPAERAVRRVPRHAARPARGDARRQPPDRRRARLAQHVPGPGRAVPRHRVRHLPAAPGVHDAARATCATRRAIDGVGHLGFLRHVAVPLVRPTLGALALFASSATWNQYLWPNLITTEQDMNTVQSGLQASSASRASTSRTS